MVALSRTSAGRLTVGESTVSEAASPTALPTDMRIRRAVKAPWARVQAAVRTRRAVTVGAVAGIGLTVVAMRAAWVSTPTLDTWFFLDIGRDVAGGSMFGLENRTFHPVPILWGAALSLLGPLAPPAAVLWSLGALALTAVAAGRIAHALTGSRIAALLGATLVLFDPLLNGLAYIGYVNIPFAALVTTALALELGDPPRRRWVWGLLIVAGLVRPEGWAFLAGYGLYVAWRETWRRRAAIAALAVGPAVVWLALEAAIFGSPFYSLKWTSAAPAGPAERVHAGKWWDVLQQAMPWPVLVAFAMGTLLLIFTRKPRRKPFLLLATLLVALLTTIGIAAVGINLPARHFTVVAALCVTVAAVGVTLPARLLGRLKSAAAVTAGVALLTAGLSVPAFLDYVKTAGPSVRVKYGTDVDLMALGEAYRGSVVPASCALHQLAVIGVIRPAETAWAFDVPFPCVDDRVSRSTDVIVRPTSAAFNALVSSSMTDRTGQGNIPPGFGLVGGNRSWEVWARPKVVVS